MLDAYTGEIRLFAGNYAPQDWLMCDGRALTITQYEDLFNLFGTTYGGDGVTTFNLPDLNGRLPIGVGQGQGLSKYVLGQPGGVETVTLTPANLPPHSHTLQVSGDIATTNVPDTSLTLAAVDPSLHLYVDTSQGTVTGTTDFSPDALGDDGGGQPHANIMPCVGLTYIICAVGTWP